MARSKLLLLVAAAAVVLAGVVAAASVVQAEPSQRRYQSPTAPPAAMPTESMAEQLPDGTWVTRLLPFAEPFATRDELEQAVADARRQGLIG